ncbi:hypothetical protein CDAR_480831 [Caerostris darwini]|uniref:Uncharacterized protein n=1 Tax=Caerostris darwini TaxID=1538125 RepID=A0AAV4RX16_9ARAC|nr:hypothetical protein CDAR_480831 [Caerostris darwini]
MLSVPLWGKVGAVEQLRFQKGIGAIWGTPFTYVNDRTSRKVCNSFYFRVQRPPNSCKIFKAFICRKKSMTWARIFLTLFLETWDIPAQSYWDDGFNILTPTASYAEKIAQLLLLYYKKIHPFLKELSGKGYCVSSGPPPLPGGPPV